MATYSFTALIVLIYVVFNSLKLGCAGVNITCFVPSLPHGRFPNAAGVRVPVNTTIAATCDTGYQIKGGHSSTYCLSTGLWSVSLQCEGTLCPSLRNPSNGHYQPGATALRYPANVTLTCASGYKMGSGTQLVRHCQADGTWSGSAPVCIDEWKLVGTVATVHMYSTGINELFYFLVVSCSTLHAQSHVLYSPRSGSLRYQANVTVSCVAGYELTPASPAVRHCQANGSWSGLEPRCTGKVCHPLQNPGHGHYSPSALSLRYPAKVTAVCQPGYQLSRSPSVRLCQANGSWSGPKPVCIGRPCDALPLLRHIRYTQGKTPLRYPSNVNVSCEPGYELTASLSSVWHCGTNGSWSGPQPLCRGVQCSDIANPVNGRFNRTVSLRYPALVTVLCNPGYRLVSNLTSSRHCQADGSWSAPQPACEAKHCSKPSNIEHGGYIIGENDTFEFMTTVECHCDPGYYIRGSDDTEHANFTTRTCQADQTWSSEEPECIGVPCQNLQDPVAGKYLPSARFLRYPAYVTIVCDQDFFSSSKSNTRLCREDGTWSEVDLTCTNTAQPQISTSGSKGIMTTVTAAVASGALFIIIVGNVIYCIVRNRRKEPPGSNVHHYEMPTTPPTDESPYSAIIQDGDAARATPDYANVVIYENQRNIHG